MLKPLDSSAEPRGLHTFQERVRPKASLLAGWTGTSRRGHQELQKSWRKSINLTARESGKGQWANVCKGDKLGEVRFWPLISPGRRWAAGSGVVRAPPPPVLLGGGQRSPDRAGATGGGGVGSTASHLCSFSGDASRGRRAWLFPLTPKRASAVPGCPGPRLLWGSLSRWEVALGRLPLLPCGRRV